ncbi:MAG: ATP-binding cassette domain-containing protein [Synergistaceae bacterium]|nr:ATP-binding cassette domain-containing protein [Synergistaceae bacterium]
MSEGKTEKTGKILLALENLRKWYAVRSSRFGTDRNYVKAVNDVSLTIQQGETLGVVGESGCGKTTLGHMIIRLLEPTGGKIEFDGRDITRCDERQLRPLRKDMQIIFQDPYSSLDPRMTVGDIIAEPFVFQKMYSKAERRERVRELMAMCGLDPIYVRRYPHEFSGGQRQRIGIARSLALTPKLMVCDEPVSALDVSIQSQIINLLTDLQTKMGLTYMFISHNLNVVYHISDRIAVMYLGYVVEIGSREDVYFHAAHPYTQALIGSILKIEFGAPPLKAQLKGDLPSSVNLPPGCPFGSRCPHVYERCKAETPSLRDLAPGHQAACHMI